MQETSRSKNRSLNSRAGSADDRSAEKVKELTEKLETGVKEIFNSENYVEYLRTMSQFTHYSTNNSLLIAMQHPGATHVASYNAWQQRFDRQVERGEKGIKILAPAPYKVTYEQQKRDDQGHPVFKPDGTPEKEQVEIVKQAYKAVTVFDISQTTGKELPTLTHALTGDVEGYRDFYAALQEVSPSPVRFDEIPGQAYGYFRPDTDEIVIRKGLSEEQTVKTTIHEIGHALLHSKDADPAVAPDRMTKEIQAESIAFVVSSYYGIDTSAYSFGYISGWSEGKDAKELKSSMDIIRKTSCQLIDRIDAKLEERKLEREKEIEEESRSRKPEKELDVLIFDDRHIHHGRG